MIIASKAQNISSFTVIPSQPTTADSVRVIIRCDFTSGGCVGEAMLAGINGNVIVATASHCVGMLTVICTDYDTVIIPPLGAGNYSFEFTLITGDGFPCVPGTFPLDFDSTSFTVSNATEINEINAGYLIQLLPNPSNGKFIIRQKEKNLSLIKIYSLDGRLLKAFQLNEIENEINCVLSSGVYTAVYECNNKKNISRLIIAN